MSAATSSEEPTHAAQVPPLRPRGLPEALPLAPTLPPPMKERPQPRFPSARLAAMQSSTMRSAQRGKEPSRHLLPGLASPRLQAPDKHARAADYCVVISSALLLQLDVVGSSIARGVYLCRIQS
ncbi:hypothetical protein ZWY2020_057620 [Hordeum vulgare]|nr:hypothetical protein ZWY2020_057620 [Hordeum vulgare]